MKIIFATHNKHKLQQVKTVLKDFEVVGLEEIGITEEIEDTANSYRGNAELKASKIHNLTGEVCLADDSGISIDAFDGWPGVQTHRFLGNNATSDERNNVILAKLKNIRNRDCTVICSICLIDKQGKVYFKEGTFDSQIAQEKKGENKFGFDEILIYKDGKTLAEVSDEEKLQVNARSVALSKMMPILKEIEKDCENNKQKVFEIEKPLNDAPLKNLENIEYIKSDIKNTHTNKEKTNNQQNNFNKKETENKIEQKHSLIRSLLERM